MKRLLIIWSMVMLSASAAMATDDDNLLEQLNTILTYCKTERLGTEEQNQVNGALEGICNLITTLSETGKNDYAMLLIDKCIEICEACYGPQSQMSAGLFDIKAVLYGFSGNYAGAVVCDSLACSYAVGIPDTIPGKAKMLHNMATHLCYAGRVKEALNYEKRALPYLSPDIKLNGLTAMSVLLEYSGDYDGAYNYNEQALQFCRNNGIVDLTLLNNYALLCNSTGRYDKAAELITEALNVATSDDVKYGAILPSLHNSFALILSGLGKTEEALAVYKKTLQLLEDSNRENSDLYVVTLSNVGNSFLKSADFKASEYFLSKADSLCGEPFCTARTRWAVWSNFSLLYHTYGNIEKCFDYCRLVISDMEANNFVSSNEYATKIMNLGTYYIDMMNDYASGADCYSKALNVIASTLGKNSARYAEVMVNWCDCQIELGINISDNLALMGEQMQLLQKYEGAQTLRYLQCAERFFQRFESLGLYDSREMYNSYKTLARIAEQVCGKNSQFYVHAIQHQATYAFELGMKDTALELDSLGFECSRQSHDSDFALALDAQLRYACMAAKLEQYEIARQLFGDYLHNYRLHLKKFSVSMNNYQRLLWSHFVLNDRLLPLVHLGCTLKDNPKEYFDVAIDALLMDQALQYGYSLDVTSEDIRQSLKDEEAAISIYGYRSTVDSMICYDAFIISPQPEYNMVVPLFRYGSGERPSVLNSKVDCYNSSVVYDMIWTRIFEALPGCTRFYVSANDEFEDVSLSDLCDGNGKRAGDSVGIYQMSSLVKLLQPESDRFLSTKTSVLYGGLFYGDDGNTVATSGVRGAAEGYDYLEGTAEEINQVENIMEQEGINCSLYSEYMGTEESFRQIQVSNPAILHLATHGYFVDEEEYVSELIKGYVSDDDWIKLEVELLKKSGLVLSGASSYMTGSQQKNYPDDGFLSAAEISEMDLRKCDLLVLSACSTGRHTTTAIGGMGLSYAFNLAGVHSMLMSLWEVDDKATCRLMVEFYTNWLSKKMTKHDALEVSKRTIRETPGWENPRYWAAFILLDGLD